MVRFEPSAFSQTFFDKIGITLFRETTTNLNGSGIRVAQPEAYDSDTNTWEVNPTNFYIRQPISIFTYYSANGTTNGAFPNSVGLESGHADSVANYFYGVPNLLATNVAHVDSYDANYFVQYGEIDLPTSTNFTATLPPTNIDDAVVNQSFDQPGYPVSLQQASDSTYDNYAAQYATLFVTGVGDGGPVSPPGTCYNGIGVGAIDGGTSIGPTLDNGRCKPDIVAYGGSTSYSSPQISGSAAILIQAALRGDGGSNTNDAADIRTVKAILLNGAVKPSNWTNSTSSPLDARYGAGILNLFNSYQQFIGGEHGYSVSNSVSQGSAHPPTTVTGTVPALTGWNFHSISSSQFVPIFSSAEDGVEHYFFNITNNAGINLTATLVWERQQNQTNINHLALFLYNCANSNLITCCTSAVDNVQHIFVSGLPAGTYDLQVWKAGGSYVSASESYALAWTFSAIPMAVTQSGPNINLSWPAYPAGATLKATTNLDSPIVWTTNNISYPTYTNGMETVSLPANNAARFFELTPP
ncbi:MAG TPA: S8 family serine peptidase [Verrucomicrobiae bacterium]